MKGRPLQTFVTTYLDDLRGTLAGLDVDALAQAIGWVHAAGREGHTIFSCGNGGSASIASHFVNDLVKGASDATGTRFKAICLADSVSTLTAVANDTAYEAVFVDPLRVFVQAGDILVAISGSGNSPNVLRAVECANGAGCKTIGLTRRDGGRLREIVQLPLDVPNTHMGRLEDAFSVIIHLLTYPFMDRVLGAD